MPIFNQVYPDWYIPQTAPQLNVLTLVLPAAFGTSCIHCYELSDIVSLVFHEVLCLCEKMVEVFLIYGVYRFTINVEKTKKALPEFGVML